jgi:hypothetical protein
MRGTTAAPAATSTFKTLTSGGCCGFHVDSPIPLHYLRPGPGQPLQLREADAPRPAGRLVMSWRAQPEYPHTVTLSKNGATYTLDTTELGWFQVDPGAASIAMSRSPQALRREVGLWGIPAALCAIHRGDLPIHAAAVEVNGAAILLAAPGHFGKTTLAAAFFRAGHRVLAEDLTFCRPSSVSAVLPGPSLLRLRTDVFERMPIRGTEVVLQSMGRAFLMPDAARRGDSAPVPLRAIVFLRRSSAWIGLDRVPLSRALRDLWSLSVRLPADEDRSRCFSSLAELVRSVPAWDLRRPLELGELDRTVQTIVATCGGEAP